MLFPSVHALLSWYTFRSVSSFEWNAATFAIVLSPFGEEEPGRQLTGRAVHYFLRFRACVSAVAAKLFSLFEAVLLASTLPAREAILFEVYSWPLAMSRILRWEGSLDGRRAFALLSGPTVRTLPGGQSQLG